MKGYYNILYPYLHQTYATSFLLFTLCKKTEVNTSPFYGKLFVIYIIKINRKIILINRLDFFAGCHYMKVLF